MKRINHKTLAIVSGIILIIIISVNIASAPGEESIPIESKQAESQQSVSQKAESDQPEVTQQEVGNPRAVIDLSNSGLTEVPGVTFKRTKIEVLDVSNNNLRGALQAEIRHMSSLRVLDLSDNMFTGVPAEVGQLQNLLILDLSNNSITGLPHEIGNLQKLETLDLRGNEYSEFDLEIIKKNLPATTEILTD